MRRAIVCVTACLFVAIAGCSMTSKATDFNGMKDFEGDSVAHLNTTNVALHLLFKDPLWGNASLNQVVSDLTTAAKAEGADDIRIVQSKKNTMWWILPPLSFIVQPVVSNVAADVK